MRPIKFRAWDRETNKMVYSYTKETDNTFDFWYGYDPKRYDWQQFTGLLDKNGKEIYEGDIVRILYTNWGSKEYGTPEQQAMELEDYKKSISKIGIVVYSGDRYYLEFESEKYGMYHDTIFEGTHGEKEIIGNIYENPDLIKPN